MKQWREENFKGDENGEIYRVLMMTQLSWMLNNELKNVGLSRKKLGKKKKKSKEIDTKRCVWLAGVNNGDECGARAEQRMWREGGVRVERTPPGVVSRCSTTQQCATIEIFLSWNHNSSWNDKMTSFTVIIFIVAHFILAVSAGKFFK